MHMAPLFFAALVFSSYAALFSVVSGLFIRNKARVQIAHGSTPTAARRSMRCYIYTEKIVPQTVAGKDGIATSVNGPLSLTALQRQIFCNVELNGSNLEAVGFDMDFTLAQYNVDFDLLAFNGAKKKLVNILHYPKAVLDIPHDPTAFRRGLIIDKSRGNIIKADRHRYSRRAMHGLRQLTQEERKATYTQNTPPSFTESNYVSVDTLFLLIDAILFANLVQMKNDAAADANAAPEMAAFFANKSFEQLYKDLRHCVDLCHRDGDIKDAVMRDPSKYIIYDDGMVEMLQRLKNSGKKIFLLTNSMWEYTQVVMDYLVNARRGGGGGGGSGAKAPSLAAAQEEGVHEASAKAPEGRAKGNGKGKGKGITKAVVAAEAAATATAGSKRDEMDENLDPIKWEDLFDVIIVGANKPGFLTDDYLGLFRVDRTTGVLHNVEDKDTLSYECLASPSGGGKVFQGGHWQDLHRMLEISAGDRILYVGDHMYSDILRSKRTLGWRTCLIIPELEVELEVSMLEVDAQEEVLKWRRLQYDLDEYIDLLRNRIGLGVQCQKELQLAQEKAIEVKEIVRNVTLAYNNKFNVNWGQIFKSSYQQSRFAKQVSDYACLYTSRASNLGLINPNRPFRPVISSYAHDQMLDIEFFS